MGRVPPVFFSAILFACLFESNEYFQINNDFLRFLPSFSRVLYSRRVVQMTGQSPTLSLNSSVRLNSSKVWEESPNTIGQQAG